MPKMPTARAFSAGGLVFRRRGGSIEVALVGKGEPRLWALPKGLPNQGESAEEAALREVEEETGLAVRLVAPIDDIEYWFVADGRRIHKTVRYFLMEWVGGSEARHDWEYDEVAWFPAEEAARRMAYANEQHILEQALALLPQPGAPADPMPRQDSPMEATPKKTPLYEAHLRLGARMIEFAGWWMPVQYRGILEEHRAVRQAVGLFDLCHMGEIGIAGPAAQEFLQRIVTDDVRRLEVGQAQYNLLCREDGGILDDAVLYRTAERYIMVTNAVNADQDFAWLRQQAGPGVRVEDLSAETGLLGLQGPRAEAALQPLVSADLSRLGRFRLLADRVGDIPVLIARTGYTGEDGFEIFGEAQRVEQLWDTLLGEGVTPRPVPCGLGARDTLRLEAALPLYGHEIDAHTNPLEAGLGRFVSFDKGEFIGRQALVEVRQQGPARRLVGLEMMDRGVARAGCLIVKNGQTVGRVTSGTYSPTLNRSIALGYAPPALAVPGQELGVVVRGRKLRACVVPLPFYRRGR